MAARLLLLLVFVCVLQTLQLSVEGTVLCEEGFCTKFRQDTRCATPAVECSINNATHSGMLLPSATICNCCEYCLPLFNAGQPCSLGGPGDGITVGRCGHGLTCHNETRTCVRMTTKCHDDQDDFDARHARGETGVLERRPECDVRGDYATYDCVPSQTCFCQSEEGERLFGEVLFTGKNQEMPCGCSRMIQKVEKYIASGLSYPVVGLRCTSDGNFNPVQCIDRVCYCVDTITGEVVGTDTINLDEQRPSELPCYIEELDLFPIRNDTEPPYNYTSPCYDSIKEKEELIEQSIKDGFNVDFFTSFNAVTCMPDGTFGRTTINANGSKICIDKRGDRIGDFEARPNTPEFNNMDCKCAKTSSLMSASTERPRCCSNGNFRPVQCRRGLCRCVDSDGRQVGAEARDVTALHCYTDDWRNC
ncbi:uncharacterized protein LOC123879038 isoform X1 [Maniola jurtina]|uniref:uncharacterized protein LOC123879038 isoform X1 n=1 Tax=Maniola jurtina TaxID=191418 RepID=UPI001E68A1EC|nr:uncharacterized protein LOC123879038 isoform X1 [Maniola jurtina]